MNRCQQRGVCNGWWILSVIGMLIFTDYGEGRAAVTSETELKGINPAQVAPGTDDYGFVWWAQGWRG